MYTIDGKIFTLKNSYTLDELDELNEMTKSLFPDNSNLIVGNFTKGRLQRFLELTLKCNEEIPNGFFGKVTEQQFAEIFKDFFLSRIGLMKNTQSSLRN